MKTQNIENNKDLDIVGYSKGKLIIDVKDTTSIYYTDHTTKRITRKVSKNLTIKYDTVTYDVSEVNGLKYHLGVE